jgi:hypothetical protein
VTRTTAEAIAIAVGQPFVTAMPCSARVTRFRVLFCGNARRVLERREEV